MLGISKAAIILAYCVKLKARGKDYFSKCSHFFFFLAQLLPSRNSENVDFNLSHDFTDSNITLSYFSVRQLMILMKQMASYDYRHYAFD